MPENIAVFRRFTQTVVSQGDTYVRPGFYASHVASVRYFLYNWYLIALRSKERPVAKETVFRRYAALPLSCCVYVCVAF